MPGTRRTSVRMIRKYGSRRHEALIPPPLRNHRVKEISFLCWIDRTTLLIVHAFSPKMLRLGCFKQVDEIFAGQKLSQKGTGLNRRSES